MDSLNVSGPVTFLVDTGATISVLSLADATRLYVDYAKFNNCSDGTLSGPGDTESDVYLVEAGISLPYADGGERLNFNIRIGVAKHGPRRSGARDYSLLGRDVLNEVRLVVERRRNRLTLERR
jgi:hypothetical protein